MNQPAKAQEPSMEEILASIRRIIADDDAGKPNESEPAPPKLAVAPAPAAPAPAPPSPPQAPAMSHDDIDEMLADLDQPVAPDPRVAPEPERQPHFEPEPEADILDLTEAMAASSPPPEPEVPSPAFVTIGGESDVMFSDAEELPHVFAAEPAHDPEPAHREPAHEPEPAYEPGPPHESAPPSDQPLLGSQTRAAVDAAFNSLAHTVLVQNARTLEDLVREMLRPMLKSWLDDNLPSLVERLVRAEIERVSRGRS